MMSQYHSFTTLLKINDDSIKSPKQHDISGRIVLHSILTENYSGITPQSHLKDNVHINHTRTPEKKW